MEDGGDEGPKLRIVSSRTEREQELEHVRSQLRWELVEHSANILRVVRGAGKPWEIGPSAAKVLRLFEAYRGIAGAYPSSDELKAMVRISHEERDDRIKNCNPAELAMVAAERQMVSGALQVAASQLLGQLAQENRGSTELHEGMRRHREAMDRYHESIRLQSSAAKYSKPTPPRPKKSPRGEPR